MKVFDLNNKPEETTRMAKKSTIDVTFVDEPFQVETKEGTLTISPDTVDDWENGYYLAYPSDGTKPYPIAPSFMRDNYRPA